MHETRKTPQLCRKWWRRMWIHLNSPGLRKWNVEKLSEIDWNWYQDIISKKIHTHNVPRGHVDSERYMKQCQVQWYISWQMKLYVGSLIHRASHEGHEVVRRKSVGFQPVIQAWKTTPLGQEVQKCIEHRTPHQRTSKIPRVALCRFTAALSPRIRRGRDASAWDFQLIKSSWHLQFYMVSSCFIHLVKSPRATGFDVAVEERVQAIA